MRIYWFALHITLGVFVYKEVDVEPVCDEGLLAIIWQTPLIIENPGEHWHWLLTFTWLEAHTMRQVDVVVLYEYPGGQVEHIPLIR